MSSEQVIDNEKETPNLSIEFTHLWSKEIFKSYIQSGIPKDSIQLCLMHFYTYKMWEYVNAKDYESLEKLEWIIELHNLLQQLT